MRHIDTSTHRHILFTLIFVSIISVPIQSWSQNNWCTVIPPREGGQYQPKGRNVTGCQVDASNAEHTPTLTIYLNFHFYQNFDGNLVSLSQAETVVQNTLYWANYYLDNMEDNTLPAPGGVPSPIAPPLKIEYVRYFEANNPLDPNQGIFLHDETRYWGSGQPNPAYPAKVVNVHFTLNTKSSCINNCGCGAYGGCGFGESCIWLDNVLEMDSQGNLTCNDWEPGNTLNHEIGHYLNLSHAQNCNNECDGIDIDVAQLCQSVCPTHSVCNDDTNSVKCPPGGPNDPAVCAFNISVDNNLMGYNEKQLAITPCQWSHMYTHAANNKTTRHTYCANEMEDITVTESETWSNMRLVNANIVVKTGARLTVDCELQMGAEKEILVERGAKLTVTGTITNLCYQERWGGIRVQGNADMEQPDPSVYLPQPQEAGIVYIDGGTLTMARTAIDTQDDTKPWPEFKEYWGGVVYANNATFTDNRRAASFSKYDFENKSAFIRCDFVGVGFDEYGVTSWGCHGIDFVRNSFTGLTEAGIYTTESTYAIYNLNTFDDVNIGVFADATGPQVVNSVIEVGRHDTGANSFQRNVLDIYWSNVDYGYDNEVSRIYGNDLLSPDGVQIQGTSSFLVKNNFFSNDGRSLLITSSGNGSGNEIKTNTMISDIGFEFEGRNDHLKFLCNNFTCANNDVIVRGISGESGEIGTQLAQGAAGNCFTTNGTDIATIGSTVSFDYFHRELPCEEPLNSGNYLSIPASTGSDCDEMFENPYKLDLYGEESEFVKWVRVYTTSINQKDWTGAEKALLQILQIGSVETENYYKVQRIRLEWLRNYYYRPSGPDSLFLRSISASDDKSRFYARALLRRFYGDSLNKYLEFSKSRGAKSTEQSVGDKEIASIRVYPNPVEDILNIDCSAIKGDVITVYSIEGRIVHEQEYELNARIYVAKWRKGNYYICIYKSGKIVASTKVIRR